MRYEAGEYYLNVNGEDSLKTEILINSSGLSADKIASMTGIDVKASNYQLHYCKGEYFSYAKPSFLRRLIYPAPEQDLKGLGIHAVIDLAGGLKFGPSAEYVKTIDYQVNPAHRKMFFRTLKDLYPMVKEEDLSPDQAGIRPKLQGPGESFRDFVIRAEGDKGFPGFINLIGIESPGLTGCLAIGNYVANLLK